MPLKKKRCNASTSSTFWEVIRKGVEVYNRVESDLKNRLVKYNAGIGQHGSDAYGDGVAFSVVR